MNKAYKFLKECDNATKIGCGRNGTFYSAQSES